jgi:hypothetical protein
MVSEGIMFIPHVMKIGHLLEKFVSAPPTPLPQQHLNA